jgi:hypothetical protein
MPVAVPTAFANAEPQISNICVPAPALQAPGHDWPEAGARYELTR